MQLIPVQSSVHDLPAKVGIEILIFHPQNLQWIFGPIVQTPWDNFQTHTYILQNKLKYIHVAINAECTLWHFKLGYVMQFSKYYD